MIVLVSSLALILMSTPSSGINLCNDWFQYKDTKCIKVVEKTGTADQALSECSTLGNTTSLLTIQDNEEQEFLNQLLLKYSKLSDRVWIGLRLMNESFEWNDGSDVEFTNWISEDINEKIHSCDACVQMSLFGPTLGKWSDESCRKRALIVCQKRQELNLNVLRFAIDNVSQVYQQIIEEQKQKITKLEDKVDNSVIPIGFIYTQLPNQSEPQTLWPKTSWSDVTQEYSGLFFRAEGGGSAKFGQIQHANQSWISDVTFHTNNVYNHQSSSSSSDVGLTKGSWEEFDMNSYRYVYGVSLYTTSGEVRPKNTAVRVWKRIQ